jgi:DNA adenine methylase
MPSYPGGKNGPGVYQTIINLMPPHQVYCEPFLGGGAVMRNKRPALQSIGVDADERVIDMWRSLTEVRGTYRITLPGPGSLQAKNPPIGWLPLGPELARSLTLVSGDGIRYLQKQRWNPGDLIYCDPPYLMETRSSGPLYKWEMREAEHERLLRVLVELPCMVIISGYDSKLYRENLWHTGKRERSHDAHGQPRKWEHVTFEAMTRGGMATEHLWFNYPPPVELHDYRYLGKDYRERENIKKQQKRWRGKLERMTPLQRQALLSVLAEGHE